MRTTPSQSTASSCTGRLDHRTYSTLGLMSSGWHSASPSSAVSSIHCSGAAPAPTGIACYPTHSMHTVTGVLAGREEPTQSFMHAHLFSASCTCDHADAWHCWSGVSELASAAWARQHGNTQIVPAQVLTVRPQIAAAYVRFRGAAHPGCVRRSASEESTARCAHTVMLFPRPK